MLTDVSIFASVKFRNSLTRALLLGTKSTMSGEVI
jgi:hypothetical protein